MTKYSVTNYITHGRFPEVGEKQKTERKREKKKKRRDRTMAITMAKLRMAHASTRGRALTHFGESPVFHLFLASVQSRPPGLPLVPGVLFRFLLWKFTFCKEGIL